MTIASYIRIVVASLAFVFCQSAVLAADKDQLTVQTDSDLGFFTGPREELLGRMKKLGIYSIKLPEGFQARDDVRLMIEELVTQYFNKAGIEVVPLAKWTESFERTNKQLGGVYDPVTGAQKNDQHRAAVSNANREFIENNNLDGFIAVGVLQQKAEYISENAYWASVKEKSTGHLPANAIAAFFSGTNSRGHLPALSLLIQIRNTEDKVEFGRWGGIQLEGYYDPRNSKGVNGFLFVAPDDLLRDRARMERAVRISTLPLILSARQIALSKDDRKVNPELIKPDELPPPPAGKPQPEPSPLKVERDQILSSVHHLAVAPLSIGRFKVPQEVQDDYNHSIMEELKPLGWDLIFVANASEVVATEFKKSGPLYDTYSGKLDFEKVKTVRKNILAAVGNGKPVDAILWPDLIRTIAPHHFGDAQWDGVTQNAITLGITKKSFWVQPGNGTEGAVGAVSLGVIIRNADDAVLYQSRGGIQLTQQIVGKNPVDLSPGELFHSPVRDHEAIRVALRDLILTPEALEEELHPDLSKKKKSSH